MPIKKTPHHGHRPKPPSLRWHKNHIGEWREDAELSQQEVADRLADRGVELDRVSIGRIEGGKQVTTIEVLEAMASLFGTDVHSMINLAPSEARELSVFASLDARERRRWLRLMQADRHEEE